MKLSTFGVFLLFLPLAITAVEGPEGYSSLAIMAFGACGCPCPQILLLLRKHGI